MAQDTTILVKKADGTFVRMSLAELQAKQQRGGSPKMVAPPSPSAPAATSAQPPARPKDVKPFQEKEKFQKKSDVHRQPPHRYNSPEPPSPKKKSSTDDIISLLEEELPPLHRELPRTSPGRDKQIEAVIKQLSFTVPLENSNRLRTVIQLYLKDIRTEEQTREVLMRRVIDGGLGLRTEQARELIELCSSPVDRSTKKIPAGLPTREGEQLPSIYHEPPVPATTTPFNAFVHGSTSLEEASATPPAFKLNTQSKAHSPMNDIVTRPDTFGPVDEIRFFTLTDFRRLAPTPEEAASRLKQKFFNLKNESILLFLDGWEAWTHSPLYAEYITLTADHLARRLPLTTVAVDKTKIQLAEIKALVNMEKQLTLV